MENPQGGLSAQQYLKTWMTTHRGKVVVRGIDYCAWQHPYMKPTDIWTTKLWWEPQGVFPCVDGKCGGKCSGGSLGESNRWGHVHKLGQQSWQMVAGRGRLALKAAVPVLLHKELLEARQDTNLRRKKLRVSLQD